MATEITSSRLFLCSNDADEPGSPQTGDICVIANASYVKIYDGSSWLKDSRGESLLAAAVLSKLNGTINVSII